VRTDARGIPLKSEFEGPAEIMLEVLARPDGQGRQMFRAYWLTDQAWVPGGVRAQVFTAKVRPWMEERIGKGHTVRLIGRYEPCE